MTVVTLDSGGGRATADSFYALQATVGQRSVVGRTQSSAAQYEIAWGFQAAAHSAPQAPAGPSSLTATAISATRIDLSWSDNSGDELGFRIERKTTAGGTWSEITTVTADVITYPNTGLSSATLYYYRVRAHNAEGNSPYSNETSATTFGSPPAPVLAAEPPFTSGTSNVLTWAAVTDAVGYYLEYADNPAFASPANSDWITTATWMATSLADGGTYYYRVKCRNASLVESNWSNVVNSCQDASPPQTAVSALLSFQTTAVFNISWSGSDAASALASVRLYFRRGTVGQFLPYGGTYTASPILFNSAATGGDGDYYFYTVGSDNVGNEESPPGTPDAWTTVLTSQPLTPVMAAEPAFTSGTANLVSWSNVGAPGYYLEWSANALFLPVSGNSGWTAATQRLVSGLTNGQTYYYRVKSRNAALVESEWSNVVSSRQDASAPTMPGVPTDNGAYTSLTLVRFNWTAASDSISGVASYDIQVGTTVGGNDLLDTNVGNVLTRTVTGSNGRTLYARVRARDNAGNVGPWSGNSDGITIDTSLPSAPGVPRDGGAYTSTTAVRFTWTEATDAGTGVAFYDLQAGTAPGAGNIFNGNVGNVLTRTVTGSNGQTLYARVRAHDAVGHIGLWSGNSDGITVDTVRPRLTGVTSLDYQTLVATFNEAVVGADQPSNYACTHLLLILGVSRLSDTQYRLTTSDQRPGSSYSLTAGSAITDRAVNSMDPAYCSQTFVTVAGPPAAPSNLRGTVISSRQINLSWVDNADNEQRFEIERRSVSSSAWERIATVAPDVTLYEDRGTSPGQKHSYRVRACNSWGNSPYSNPWPDDKVIIVAGGGNYVGNAIASQTQALADRVFFTCSVRGYTAAEVYYLSAFSDWRTHPNVDAQATTQTFWSAIDTWSSGTARLFIYLIDHGSHPQPSEYYFRLNPTEYVSARDLDAHLDTLQTQTNCDVILIVDCCYAGGFVQQCRAPAGKRRVVVAATTPTGLAIYSAPAGSESFSFYFLSFAIMGNTLTDCFDWTRLSFAAMGNPGGQNPWLDDDGDGDSDKRDGALARQHVLGRYPAFGLNAPTILNVATTQTVSVGRPATLWAQLDAAVAAKEVWAIVVSNTATYVAGQPVTNLTRVNLAFNAPLHRWQAVWAPGTKHVGENTVTYFALSEDTPGTRLVATPKSSGLRVLAPTSVGLPWHLLK